MLPFADMSLLASTNSVAILSSCFFSIKLLGETLVWQYDLIASALICLGGVLTIFQMNMSQEIAFTRDRIQFLLMSIKSTCLIASTIVLLIMAVVSYKRLQQNVKRFLYDLQTAVLEKQT